MRVLSRGLAPALVAGLITAFWVGSAQATPLSVPMAPTSAVTVSTASLADGALGSTYTSVLTATGGIAPYTWKLAAGGVPTGLTLGHNGVITGEPIRTGKWSLTPAATDAKGHTATRPLTLRITAPVSVATAALPTTALGATYGARLTAAGGTAPYTWKLVAGGLPDGLRLDPAGAVSGTPSRTGKWSLTLAATDSLGHSSSRPLTLKVEPRLASTIAASCTPAQLLTQGTCTITVTNTPAKSIPAPTGTVFFDDSFSIALDPDDTCELAAVTPWSSTCTLPYTFYGRGPDSLYVEYYGDQFHTDTATRTTITVTGQGKQIDTVPAIVACPGASIEGDTSCTLSVGNSPGSAQPAPTGTIEYDDLGDPNPGGSSCDLLPAPDGHHSTCTVPSAWQECGAIRVRLYYYGDASHDTSTADTTEQVSCGR